MKIRRFTGRAVNGYLKFDISFFDDLTFITGINGTGKTSALNSIAALLLPRLDYLAGEYFEQITLEILHKNKKIELSATKTGPETDLRCSLFPDEQLTFEAFVPPDSLPMHRVQEYEDEYYKEILARNMKHPVLAYIEDLPTPMYLGLDRRSLSADTDRIRYAPSSIRRRQMRKNIFGRSMGQGLNEALYFAQERFQKNRRQESRLDAKFRENLFLSLLDFKPISFLGKLENPSKKELQSIEEARTNLKRLPELLNVSEEIISNNLDPLFKFLDEKLSVINRPTKRKESEEDGLIFDETFEALFEWSYNKTHIAKINVLSNIISDYNNETEAIFKRENEFLARIIHGTA